MGEDLDGIMVSRYLNNSVLGSCNRWRARGNHTTEESIECFGKWYASVDQRLSRSRLRAKVQKPWGSWKAYCETHK